MYLLSESLPIAISLSCEHTVSGVVVKEVVQCADIVPLHGQGGQWTLNRHIRDETNFVNTVPVSDMQVPGKMSIAGTSYYLASEQLQVFKKYILYICKKSGFLVSPIVTVNMLLGDSSC